MNRVTFSVVAIMLLAAATTLPFVLNAGFGKAPQGVQLSQVEASPHYRDGQFHNQLPTPGFTGQKNMLAAWWDFLMTKRENARPAQPLPLVKTDLATLPLGQDVMVWLGHSSWYLQLAGNIIPLTPVLILWMNMATSATLSFGLAFEAAERNVMNRPPRKTGQHVMDGFAVWRVAFVGSMIAIAAFILEAWLAPRGHSPEFIRTVLLQMLVTAQWVYMINCRSSDSFSLSMGLLRNKGIWLVTGVLLLMQLVIIYVPLMQSMFGTEALPLRYWFVTLVIGVAMFLVVEVEKRLTRRFRKTA